MVNPVELKIEDCYRQVCYTPDHGDPKVGIITSWTYKYIFVNYGKGGQATPPEKLNFI